VKTKKILILTERFFPEAFLVNDLASVWQSQNCSVEVLTQVPSYPYDKIMPGYRNKLFQTTTEFNGIPVHRVRTVLGYNSSLTRKILNYLSFAFLTSLWMLFRGRKYDRIFTFHSGPLTMASAGMTARFLLRKKCLIWTQDIWPESVYNYGIRKNRINALLLDLLVRSIYSAYSWIAVSCPGFIDYLKPYTRKPVHFIPQWTSLHTVVPEKRGSGPFIFTFAGNIGSVQNLARVVSVFGQMNCPCAELHIVGDGILLPHLKALAAENHFENIVFTGRLPMERMPEIFECSDMLIISLNAEFNLTIPAKFQAYIASGRPLLGIVAGDTKMMIEKYGLGVVADPSDPDSIAAAFRRCLESSPEERLQWRRNALALSEEQFNREKIIRQLIEAAE